MHHQTPIEKDFKRLITWVELGVLVLVYIAVVLSTKG